MYVAIGVVVVLVHHFWMALETHWWSSKPSGILRGVGYVAKVVALFPRSSSKMLPIEFLSNEEMSLGKQTTVCKS